MVRLSPILWHACLLMIYITIHSLKIALRTPLLPITMEVVPVPSAISVAKSATLLVRALTLVVVDDSVLSVEVRKKHGLSPS